jgi:hypothetical protein
MPAFSPLLPVLLQSARPCDSILPGVGGRAESTEWESRQDGCTLLNARMDVSPERFDSENGRRQARNTLFLIQN